MDLITRGVICSRWGCQHFDWVFLRSIGSFGGILVFWDRRVVEKWRRQQVASLFLCRFKNVADNFERALSGAYGPNVDRDRQLLWEELAGIRSWWNVPWCVGGDFNVVRFPLERLGAESFTPAIYKFSDFIADHGVLDQIGRAHV